MSLMLACLSFFFFFLACLLETERIYYIKNLNCHSFTLNLYTSFIFQSEFTVWVGLQCCTIKTYNSSRAQKSGNNNNVVI